MSLSVQRPPVQLQSAIGVADLIAPVHRVPLAVPEMAVVRPLTAVNTGHRHSEGLDVDDVVIVREEAAPGSMGDQLQTIHVGVNGQSRRGKHQYPLVVLFRLFSKRSAKAVHDALPLGGFIHIINEFYVKDSSKKVKAVMKQKGESGEYLTTNPPYGYMKDSANPKRHWIVDDEAAAIVRQIFAWCMEGFGPSQIAKKLKEAKVDCPTVHWMKMGRNAPAKTPDNPYDWAPRTITGILEKQEYLGHMVNFKTRKQSYRSKKKLENPPDQWKIFENTHEAIIDEETFARVQELRKNKRRPARTGKTNMFSGLVRCADCGEKLYYCTSNSFETRQDHFVCSTSRKRGKEVCDTHFIRAVVLEEGTLQHMRLVIQCVADYEDAFRRALGAKRSEEVRKELSAKKKTLQKSENRLAELDRLFKRIYEDMVNGKLSEARFQMLADDYEQEQADLRAKIEMLENEIQNQEDQAENVDRFIRQAKKYLYLEKLTPTILNDMVNAVYVHAPDKSSGHRVQDVTISYNYIGILPANLLYDVMNGKAA